MNLCLIHTGGRPHRCRRRAVIASEDARTAAGPAGSDRTGGRPRSSRSGGPRKSVVPLREVAVNFCEQRGMRQALCSEAGHGQVRCVADPRRAEICVTFLALLREQLGDRRGGHTEALKRYEGRDIP